MEHIIYVLSFLLVLLVLITASIQYIFNGIFELVLSTKKQKLVDIYYLIFVSFSSIIISGLYYYTIYFIISNNISLDDNIILDLINLLLVALFFVVNFFVLFAGYILFSRLRSYFVNKVNSKNNNKDLVV